MIDPLFQFYRLNPDGVKKSARVAELFTRLLDDLTPLLGVGHRETALVRTKLEEACFFAKKALAVLPENQV